MDSKFVFYLPHMLRNNFLLYDSLLVFYYLYGYDNKNLLLYASQLTPLTTSVYCVENWSAAPGRDSHIKGAGMLVGNFELNP